jgi:putative nucleotidyltransferase with HDIG domain
MSQATWAEEIARGLLETSLPRRWAHTQGVAAKARSLASVLGKDADLVEAAAWLHDIGYSADLVGTGFHPLDGARYLRDAWRASPLLCRLVANHTSALIEAEERGLAAQLAAEFPAVDGVLSDALTFCDVTTDPYGRPTTVEERLAEIHARYGPGHLVSRSIARSSDQLRDAADAIDRLVQPRSVPSAACH